MYVPLTTNLDKVKGRTPVKAASGPSPVPSVQEEDYWSNGHYIWQECEKALDPHSKVN